MITQKLLTRVLWTLMYELYLTKLNRTKSCLKRKLAPLPLHQPERTDGDHTTNAASKVQQESRGRVPRTMALPQSCFLMEKTKSGPAATSIQNIVR